MVKETREGLQTILSKFLIFQLPNPYRIKIISWTLSNGFTAQVRLANTGSGPCHCCCHSMCLPRLVSSLLFVDFRQI